MSGHVPWSTPARIKAGAMAAMLLACCLAAVIVVVSVALGGDFRSIGQRDAPEVSAATGLYFAAGDMDAQVANVLLVGGDASLAANRSQDMASYGSDRETADQDLRQATATEAGSAAAQRELQSVLDGVGRYEALAADAMLSDQQARGAGRPTATALAYYQQATDLMRTAILPAAGRLTAVSAAGLGVAYQSGQSTAGTGIMIVAVTGAALLAALVALQVFFATRFRRLLNPALAVATLIAVISVTATALRLSAEAGHLRVAKQDAFDSIVALTQARAVSYDANADESRYLVDPGRAAQYQEAFATKSQQLAEVGKVDISGYDAALAADVSAYQDNSSDVRFGGFLGAEFRNVTFPGERAAAVRTLLAYQVYERDDRELRALARANLAAAVAFDTGTTPGQSDWAFNTYDAALTSVITINSRAFTAAVQAGQGGVCGRDTALGAAGAVLPALLVLIGVRPRVAEYR